MKAPLRPSPRKHYWGAVSSWHDKLETVPPGSSVRHYSHLGDFPLQTKVSPLTPLLIGHLPILDITTFELAATNPPPPILLKPNSDFLWTTLLTRRSSHELNGALHLAFEMHFSCLENTILHSKE